MKFLFLEPFFGGSHENFARGLAGSSRHDIELFTLPARWWKWRMRGAALHFIREAPPLSRFDGIITSSLMSLADFRSLAGGGCPPVLVYFHENQLAYPIADGQKRDAQFGFTDITTALSADRVAFNSRFHHDCFFQHLPEFIGRMPEYRPDWVVRAIAAKSCILHPGCHFSPGMPPPFRKPCSPPLIIWNHRWEHDKNPDAFFNALEELNRKKVPFGLALLGERYRKTPPVFDRALSTLGDRIVINEYAPRREYGKWLERGSVVVSTAGQENFGISVVEAVRRGCLPVLPNRLSYPELIPARHHEQCLYDDPSGLVEKLAAFLTEHDRYESLRVELASAMSVFAWETAVETYDRLLEEMVQEAGTDLRSGIHPVYA